MFGGIVFFEGLDKTGKTTLTRRCRFEALPAHPCLMVDRGFVGRELFYEQKHEIDFPYEQWLRTEAVLANSGIYAIVWLRSSIAKMQERHVAANEMPPAPNFMEEQDKIYQRLMAQRKRQNVTILELWTDRMSEDQCVEKILKFLGFEWRKPDADN